MKHLRILIALFFLLISALILVVVWITIPFRDPVPRIVRYPWHGTKGVALSRPINQVDNPKAANRKTQLKDPHSWESELWAFQTRFVQYSNKARRFRTTDTCADFKKHFSESDLPFLEAMLNGQPLWMWLCHDIILAICILDSDKERAFEVTTEFLERKENWRAIRGIRGPGIEDFADAKFRCVSALGYIGSPEAKAYLIPLLNRKRAQELAKAIAFPGNEYLNREQSTTIIQENAAYGLLFSRDDEAFKYVEEELEYEYANHWGEHGPRDIFMLNLAHVVGLHRFYEDKGWEEGFRLLDEQRLNRIYRGRSGIGASIIDEYIPQPPSISAK